MTTQPSDGQILDQRPQLVTQPQAVESNILINVINNAMASDNSPWVDIRSFSKFALEVLQVSGGGTFSVQLVGSCQFENPNVVSVSGSNLGAAITSSGITFPSLAGVRFLQAQLTITGTATVNVNLSAIAP